jgi:hypothetical protein
MGEAERGNTGVVHLGTGDIWPEMRSRWRTGQYPAVSLRSMTLGDPNKAATCSRARGSSVGGR